MDFTSWRGLWRRRGVALDKTLPQVLRIPAPDFSKFDSLVPRAVQTGDGTRARLDDNDVLVVADSARDVCDLVAAQLPCQVVETDLKKDLPNSVSSLAVKCADGSEEYVGSFDLLVRVAGAVGSAWAPHHRRLMAVDVKLSGSSEPLSLSCPTMKTYLEHGQRVLKHARKAKATVAQCNLVSYLFLRPSGPKFNGGVHPGAWGFVAYDVDRFLAWDIRSTRKLAPVVTLGSFFRLDNAADPEGVPFTVPPRRQTVQRNRWEQLAQDGEKRGNVQYVSLNKFVELFLRTKQNPKQQASKIGKRLRDDGCTTVDSSIHHGVGRPPKLARMSDLKAMYPQHV